VCEYIAIQLNWKQQPPAAMAALRDGRQGQSFPASGVGVEGRWQTIVCVSLVRSRSRPALHKLARSTTRTEEAPAAAARAPFTGAGTWRTGERARLSCVGSTPLARPNRKSKPNANTEGPGTKGVSGGGVLGLWASLHPRPPWARAPWACACVAAPKPATCPHLQSLCVI